MVDIGSSRVNAQKRQLARMLLKIWEEKTRTRWPKLSG
jgi:hypothetical protein